MEQGMYQEIENQRNDRIRILRKLLLGGTALFTGVVGNYRNGVSFL